MTIEVSHTIDATHTVIITVIGLIGRHEAAVLSTRLHTALNAVPSVVVVNLGRVQSCDRAGREILTIARARARAIGTVLCLIDPDDHLGLAEPPAVTMSNTDRVPPATAPDLAGSLPSPRAPI